MTRLPLVLLAASAVAFPRLEVHALCSSSRRTSQNIRLINPCPAFRSTELMGSRRSVLEIISSVGMGAVILSAPIEPAGASGGATAGGAYLLSAKQRYNARVKAGVKGFVGIGPALEAGNIDGIRAFFSQEDEGSWKDLTTAGYLLANAFRRNSTAAPDSLPSVQKWKAFAAQVEVMTKALKKKDVDGAKSEYQRALAALEDYLAKVELPPAKEIAI